MTENSMDQWLRRVDLVLVSGEQGLDLSNMHIQFKTAQNDEESPSNCTIRVYNLSEDTVKRIKGEYSRVVLQAGYATSAFGVIFDGTVKQYRDGKMPNGIDSFLDILAADGDVAYNWSTIAMTMAAGSTSGERVAAAVAKMTENGVGMGKNLIPSTGGVLPRGKVLFGMAKAIVRTEVQSQGCTWSIQNGQVNVIPLDGYLPGEAVVLTAETGLIGRPEQTEEGLRARCLLNPKIIVGGLVKVDNKSVNQTSAAAGSEIAGGQLAYNRYAGIQQFATITSDGIYRVYVSEHTGDNRGGEFYTDLICLSVDPVTLKVKPYG